MEHNLKSYNEHAELKLKQLREWFDDDWLNKYKKYDICIYACGSLGRMELAESSDLDLFIISNAHNREDVPSFSEQEQNEFMDDIRSAYSALGFPAPSKDGQYLKPIPADKLLDIGSREEDYNNSFTARMLLLLESKPVCGFEAYRALVRNIIEKYFVDFEDHQQDFSPQFLMNDIWRYWYTLCLNYEYRRDPKDGTAEKNRKRLKLKFARRITCFSMIACLYEKNIDIDYVIQCINKTPFERFETLADVNVLLQDVLRKIKIEYEYYLDLKTHTTEWWDKDPSRKRVAWKRADEFQNMLNQSFMKVIAERNSDLHRKMDMY